MKSTTTAVISALCCFSIMAGGCKKKKEEPGLFSNRHWRRTVTKATACYDWNTNQKVSENANELVAIDTVFAIQKTGTETINFLGFQMPLFKRGDTTDEYIYQGGHLSNTSSW